MHLFGLYTQKHSSVVLEMAEAREAGGNLCSSRGGESKDSSIVGCDTCSKRVTTFGWYDLQTS